MSRFWAAASSSSDSGSDSDDSSVATSSSEDNLAAKRENKWVDDSDYSDSEDEVRVVKSAKTRTFESLESSVKSIRNGMKINDFTTILSSYEDLLKTISTSKTRKIIDAHGGLPRFFIKLLCDLEDYTAERKKDKAAFKKLSPSQGRALNRIALNLRKNNKTYDKLMKEYRANPTVSSDEESSDSDSDSDDSDSDSDSDSDTDSDDDDDSAVKTKKPPAKPAKLADDSDSDSSSSSSSGSDSDSDSDSDSSSSSSSSSSSKSGSGSDDDDWASSSSSSESDSDDSTNAYSQLKGRARWLKKNTVTKPEKTVKDKEARAKERAVKREANAKARELEQERLEREADGVGDMATEDDLTAATVIRKVMEVVSSRGRKGTDNKSILRKLEALSKISERFGPRVEIPILMHVITAQFDVVRTLDDCMETKNWTACKNYLERIAGVLEDGEEKFQLGAFSEEDNDLMVGNIMAKKSDNKMKDAAAGGEMGAMDAVAADVKLVNPHTGEAETEDERAERLRVEKEANMSEEELHTIPVIGSLSLFLTRLDDEYIKSLQRTSSHSVDYLIRLRDEADLVKLLIKVKAYYARVDNMEEAAELSLRIVEHLYYRHDSIAQKVKEAEGKTSEDDEKYDSKELMKELCTFVYRFGTDRSKTRAMLCHIFHHALHDRFLEARDLLLMSHLQDNITNVGDVATMVLFNRMMVTLGLCAFRLGKVWDAHSCLTEICSERPRELLAQGISTGRYGGEKTAEQEKAEKRRQVPFHQHVNQDLLEACHLICAMLLEVPNMAAHGEDSPRKPRLISRRFRKNHEQYKRQVFTGPPEQTKDFVMRAASELMKGEWKACADLLVDLDVWKLVPGDDSHEQIKTMLTKEIKLAGLRTYLFAYSTQYDSLSLGHLCSMFDMTKNEVHSVVSKMMINRELHASWDQPTETIVLRNVKPSTLQALSLQFAEKTASLVESNERLLDIKTGNQRDDWKSGDQRSGYGQGQRRGQGGRGGSYGGRGGGGGRGRGRGGRGQGGRGGRGRGGQNNYNNKNRSW